MFIGDVGIAKFFGTREMVGRLSIRSRRFLFGESLGRFEIGFRKVRGVGFKFYVWRYFFF